MALDNLAEDVAAIGRIDAVPTILDVVCRTTGMRFAAVARVTDERWVACAVHDEINFGLQPGGELEVRSTICHEVHCDERLVVIDHVAEDPVYALHHTPKQYGFQSYISVPLRRRDGSFFGTLCAIDPVPAVLNTPQVIGMFTMFADLIAFHLDAQDRLETTEQALVSERHVSELREQFIAVLGHDLRNPLTAIAGGTSLLMQSSSLSEDARHTVGIIQGSVRRMRDLINNVLDFARGRLGGGIPVNRVLSRAVASHLNQVVAEHRAAWPGRELIADIRIDEPVFCDPARVAQLFSNLVGNAFEYGATDAPVRVTARSRSPGLELSVANRGPAIPSAKHARLFQPYYRGGSEQQAGESEGSKGLGLGLYITAEIARSHGGTIDVTSDETETVFTFRIPD